jgi:pyruvate formate lyase activating enzyme
MFDENCHHKYTGVSNRRIKENLRFLVEKGADILVRMPLIPGINDDEENIQATIGFLKGIGIKRFTVLPFHQYGSGKYASTGIPYVFQSLRQPESAMLEKLREQIAEAGFPRE